MYTKNFPSGIPASSTAIDANFTLIQSGMFVKNSIPSGVIDGVNGTFVTADQFVTGSLEVFLQLPATEGGLRLIPGTGFHYIESPVNTGFVFQGGFIPAASSVITVNYTKLNP